MIELEWIRFNIWRALAEGWSWLIWFFYSPLIYNSFSDHVDGVRFVELIKMVTHSFLMCDDTLPGKHFIISLARGRCCGWGEDFIFLAWLSARNECRRKILAKIIIHFITKLFVDYFLQALEKLQRFFSDNSISYRIATSLTRFRIYFLFRLVFTLFFHSSNNNIVSPHSISPPPMCCNFCGTSFNDTALWKPELLIKMHLYFIFYYFSFLHRNSYFFFISNVQYFESRLSACFCEISPLIFFLPPFFFLVSSLRSSSVSPRVIRIFFSFFSRASSALLCFFTISF